MGYNHQTLKIIRSTTSRFSAGDNILSNLAARWRVTSTWVLETRSAVCEPVVECVNERGKISSRLLSSRLLEDIEVTRRSMKRDLRQ